MRVDTPPVDLRNHARQTKRRLAAGGLILTIVAGTILIAVTYGTPAAGCGIAFFLAALLPVGLIGLALYFMQWLVDRADRQDAKGGKKE
jgi:TRAP-type C4-dicarboxylate transport system permease small subunit